MWIAFVAKESGIHATIVSHSIIPLFFIPMVYLVYVEIGRIVFRGRQHIIPVFMIVVSVLLMFGNVSIYTPATFFLMRTWQGKALVSNMAFPMIFWMFLWMMEDAGKGAAGAKASAAKKTKVAGAESVAKGADAGAPVAAVDPGRARYLRLSHQRMMICPWVILALINMLSGTCSSLGVIFGSGLVAILTLVLMLYARSIKYALGAVLCIIPNIIYLAQYFSFFR